MRVRWAPWRALPADDRAVILEEAASTLSAIEKQNSAAFGLLGHKGDLMLVHFRPGFDQLGEIQTCLAHLRLWDYLEQTSSYLSVVELGLYESTRQSLRRIGGEGNRRAYARLERADRADAGAAAAGDAAAPVPRGAAREVSVLLSDGSQARRR